MALFLCCLWKNGLLLPIKRKLLIVLRYQRLSISDNLDKLRTYYSLFNPHIQIIILIYISELTGSTSKLLHNADDDNKYVIIMHTDFLRIKTSDVMAYVM